MPDLDFSDDCDDVPIAALLGNTGNTSSTASATRVIGSGDSEGRVTNVESTGVQDESNDSGRPDTAAGAAIIPSEPSSVSIISASAPPPASLKPHIPVAKEEADQEVASSPSEAPFDASSAVPTTDVATLVDHGSTGDVRATDGAPSQDASGGNDVDAAGTTDAAPFPQASIDSPELALTLSLLFCQKIILSLPRRFIG